MVEVEIESRMEPSYCNHSRCNVSRCLLSDTHSRTASEAWRMSGSQVCFIFATACRCVLGVSFQKNMLSATMRATRLRFHDRMCFVSFLFLSTIAMFGNEKHDLVFRWCLRASPIHTRQHRMHAAEEGYLRLAMVSPIIFFGSNVCFVSKNDLFVPPPQLRSTLCSHEIGLATSLELSQTVDQQDG